MPSISNEGQILKWQRCIIEGKYPEQRGGHTTVLIKDQYLLVFGGHRYEREGEFTYFNDIQVFDITTNKWKQIRASGLEVAPRYGHSATLVGDRMFVFGGKGTNGNLYRDMVVLDIKNWVWAPVVSQSVSPPARMQHASLQIGRKIVIHGGWDSVSPSYNDIWIFDTGDFSWMQPKTYGVPPSPRYQHSLNLTPDGRILMFGGAHISTTNQITYFKDLYELNTSTMVWSHCVTKGDGPSPRAMHTANLIETKNEDGSVSTKLFVFGGWGTGGMQCEATSKRPGTFSGFVYDLETETWSVCKPKPMLDTVDDLPHKYGHTVCISNAGIYGEDIQEIMMIGGWDGRQATRDVYSLILG